MNWIRCDNTVIIKSTILHGEDAVHTNPPVNLDLVLSLEKSMFVQFWKDIYTIVFKDDLRWVFLTEEERDRIYDSIIQHMNAQEIV
jgi:hypothetical protein